MRKFLALAALSLAVFSAASNATVWNLAVCESMLTSDLKPFATDHASLLVSLRELKTKIYKKALGALWDGTGYETIRQSKPFDQLTTIEAAKVSARIEEIEQALTGSRVDQQILAMEFRGRANVTKAITALTDKYFLLRPEFYKLQSKLKDEEPEIEERRLKFLRGQYLSLAALNAAGLLAIDHSGGSIALTSGALIVVYDAISLMLRSYGRTNFNDKQFRRDLAMTLVRALGPEPSREWLHMQSTNLVVPSDFHKSIYNDTGDRENARLKAYMVNSFFSNFVAYTLNLYDQLKDAVQNAGDLTRRLYVDQISYWDQEANEPVWILVYRAARERPTPRKPKKVETKESREESLEGVWAPNYGRIEP